MAETKLIISVDDKLKEAFESAAAAAHANGADLIRQFMCSYVEHQPTGSEHDEWVIRQVDVALAEIEAGEIIDDEEVEAEFEQRRADSARGISA